MLSELWHDLRYRLRALTRRGQLDRDLDAEVESHITKQTEVYERQGLTRREAQRRARVDFGGVEDIKAQTREARGTSLVESLRHDLREVRRSLRTQPSFAVAVTLALAVGIGGSTATFVALKTVRHDPLPWPDDDRLVMIWIVQRNDPGQKLPPTFPEFLAWHAQATLFESVGTAGLAATHLADTDEDPTGLPDEEITTELSSAEFLRTIRIAPRLGRLFTDAEDTPDATPVALIGHGLWQRRFGGRPDIVGRTMKLDEVDTTIIGVMPDGAASPVRYGIDVWAPVKMDAVRRQVSARGWPVVARLKPGVSLADVQAEASAIVERSSARSGSAPSLDATVEPFRESRYATHLRVVERFDILAAAVFVAACANVAGLLLMRAASRRASLAIRSAVGAGRSRLLRQFLIEALTLTAAGGLGAMGVAWLVLEWSSHLGPTPLPHAGATPFDMATVRFVGGASVLAALLVIPLAAMHVARVNPADALPTSRAKTTEWSGARRLRGSLVVSQIALAMVLLVGVGLLAVTFTRISRSELGGDPKHILTFTIRFAPAQYRAFVGPYEGLPMTEVSSTPPLVAEQLRSRLEDMAGAVSVAVATRTPFIGDNAPVSYEADDATASSGNVALRIVSPRYFETMRIPLARGRDFSRDDTATSPWVAIVNGAMARQVWGDQPVLGRTIRMRHTPDEQPREIVGIVGNTRPHPMAGADTPAIYLPLGQQPAFATRLHERLLMTFLIRTDGDPMRVLPAVQPLAATVDPTRTSDKFNSLEDVIAQGLVALRHFLNIVGAFMIAVLVLAGVSVRAAVAYGMAQQSREISVRRAFGAGRGDLWRMTLARLGWIVVPGIVIGTGISVLAAPAIDGLLWSVSTTDVPTYAAAALLICAMAVVVAAGPIRRVLSSSPHTALEVE